MSVCGCGVLFGGQRWNRTRGRFVMGIGPELQGSILDILLREGLLPPRGKTSGVSWVESSIVIGNRQGW